MTLATTETADTGAAIRTAPGATHSTAPGASLGLDTSSRLLRFWRRLDWRFLLPNPNLHCVGYSGPSGELLSALQMYSQSVVLLSDEERDPAYPWLDVAVLCHPSESALKLAARMVKPGGSLYMELTGPLLGISKQSILSRRNAGVMSYARTLWQAGYDEIRAYWHRPSFENCREIVPLFDRLATRYVLSRREPARLTREAKLLASRCLLEAGLLRHIIPCYSVLAHKKVPN